MSSSSTFHPGLAFATLVVQFAMTRGSVITSLEPRRKGSGETGDSQVATQPSATGNPASSSSSQLISSASITASTATNTTASVPNASGVSSSASNVSGTSSSASSSPSSLTRTVIRSDITTAGIVGIVIGSVAILVLALMFLTKCIRRNRRKDQARDKGPTTGFLRVGSSSPVRPQTPVTEMSQTQSSPLISSAVVAGATTNPHLSRQSMSNTTASLSPLIFPAASLHHSRSLGSTSDTSAANTHTSGAHTEVTSHDALSYVSSMGGNGGQGLPPGLPSIISRSTSVTNSASAGEPVSPVSQQSELHHVLTVYQKSLENDPKGIDVGRMDTDNLKAEDSEDVSDPPPSYEEL